jgi:hypothetical protein
MCETIDPGYTCDEYLVFLAKSSMIGMRTMSLLGDMVKMDVDKDDKASATFLRVWIHIELMKPIRRGVLLCMGTTEDDGNTTSLTRPCLGSGPEIRSPTWAGNSLTHLGQFAVQIDGVRWF